MQHRRTDGAGHGGRTAFAFDRACLLHQPPPDHPESPERLRALHAHLQHEGLLAQVLPVEAREATDDDLHLCHTRAYLANVRKDIARGAPMLSTGDTHLSPHADLSARRAAGAAMAAVDAVLSGQARNAFAAVRPPGHHATLSRGMGFCLYNNVALAARHARRAWGVERILIVDWDVHHGNGTQDIFYDDPSVFFFSTHQAPWYPGTGWPDETGEGPARGTTMNCPFPAGAGRREILGAFRKKLLPAMDEFRPELVLISAGFDSREGDPLGLFRLRDEDFAELTKILMEIADRWSGGRLVSVLEGGYSLSGMPRAAAAHLRALLSGG
ncbi:MAG: histone deacetylase [Bryobacteraceae bacterium]|nr:histone deacetylase [Bryobacteraceae bacterium]MCX7605305.1 histone deacetylase [Bryobacteraceae bacterium]